MSQRVFSTLVAKVIGHGNGHGQKFVKVIKILKFHLIHYIKFCSMLLLIVKF